MHIRLGDLVSLIIREKFGPIIEKVACVLQKYGTLTLNQIRTNADLPISKVIYLTRVFSCLNYFVFLGERSFDNAHKIPSRDIQTMCI